MIGLVLAAAGSGERFGSTTPKQFFEINGIPLYLRSLRIFADHVSEAAVVVPADRIEEVAERCRSIPVEPIRVVPGGRRRQDSVREGLSALSRRVEIALIHDAARPFATGDLIQAVVAGARLHGGCIPAVPLSDTVKEVADGKVVRTLDRERLRLAQTPQGFDASRLRDALERARLEAKEVTDEAALFEWLGHPVQVVEGERSNIKITFSEDLAQ